MLYQKIGSFDTLLLLIEQYHVHIKSQYFDLIFFGRTVQAGVILYAAENATQVALDAIQILGKIN